MVIRPGRFVGVIGATFLFLDAIVFAIMRRAAIYTASSCLAVRTGRAMRGFGCLTTIAIMTH
jgi:hypothetical protein